MFPSIRIKSVVHAGLFSLAICASASIFAASWADVHPRRDQIDRRIDRQKNEVRKEVVSGQMSKPEAKEIMRDINAIKIQEKTMARTHKGHLSKREQHILNKQLNATQREIKAN